jgi:NhaP-type Na+/H+ or K+/H+ antiporter
LIVHLRQAHRETIGTDDYLALGLIALSYGLALSARTYGFLAVFAAGLALRRVERLSSRGDERPEATGGATEAAGEAAEIEDPSEVEHSPEYMARAVLGFSEQLERLGTVGLVLLIGGMLGAHHLSADTIWFVPLLFLVIRPLAVFVGLFGTNTHPLQWTLMSWFGVRGIGSIYYLMYAVEQELPDGLAERLTSIVLSTVAVSVVVHGISVTPLMIRYGRWTRRSAGHAR